MPVIEIRPLSPAVQVEQSDLNDAIQSIEYEHSVGTAAVVSASIKIWDGHAMDYDWVAARLLDHHEQFELWIDGEVVGKFYVEEVDTDYTAEGPVRMVTAYDALRPLIKETRSRVVQSVTSDAQWIEPLAEECGMRADVEESETFLSTKATDAGKKLGTTDMEWLSRTAMAFGLEMPWIRYQANDPVAPESSARETLVMRPINVDEQLQSPLDLRVVRPGADGDLEFFPRWDTGDIPEAIEVVGWDPQARKPFRVTVVATATGAQTLPIDYGDITPKERNVASGGDEVILNLLGGRKEQVDSRTRYRLQTPRGKRWIRARREYREILHSQTVRGVTDAVRYAEDWMNARIAAYLTCDANVRPNAIKAGRIRVGQVHRINGALPEHNGAWILTKVNHAQDPEGHACTFFGQRLIEGVST